MSKRPSADAEDENRRFKFFKKERNDEELPKLYSVFQGQVAELKPYGAFVKIPGLDRKQGLVHKSQISKARVEDPTEILSKGELVYCKVISLEEGKISLSMKTVNQTTGQDEDPTNVQLSLDEKKRKSFDKRERPKIELGAVLDTNCKKCGGHGHLAQDCFHTEGGKTYELVDDIDFTLTSQPTSSKKKKKEKKKKSKKLKKHKHHSVSSEGESGDDSRRKAKKKHKEKHKKRKRSRSSS